MQYEIETKEEKIDRKIQHSNANNQQFLCNDTKA